MTALTPEQEAIQQLALILETLPISGLWHRFTMYVSRGPDGAIWIDDVTLEEV